MAPIYNTQVLIGNWGEDRLKYEFDLQVFLRKRDRHELILQRSRSLFSNLLKEKKQTTIIQDNDSGSSDRFLDTIENTCRKRPLMISGVVVLFGYNVQIVASDMATKHTIDGRPKYGLALSSLVTAREVDYRDNIADRCMMTLSPITTPCCRNTFVIVNTIDESLRGTKVMYGDEFYLRAENYDHDDDPPLYVRYVSECVPGPQDRMPLQLSKIKDTNCRWTAIPLRNKDHLEKLGTPVVTAEKLVVKNCVAGTALFVMNQAWMQTFFGPECGVTCRDVYDRQKLRTAENVFTLVSDIATKKQGE